MNDKTTETPNKHRCSKSGLIGLVMLQDVLPLFEDFAELDGLEYKETRKPAHGACCTCQDCGYDHDSCVCNHNELLHILRLMTKLKARDFKMEPFRSGVLVNEDYDMAKISIELPITEAKQLMEKLSAT